jgi:hypothetical protein
MPKKEPLISSALNIFIFRPAISISLLIIELLGLRLFLTGQGTARMLGLIMLCVLPAFCLIFSYLAFADKIGSLNDFWKDILLYDVYYRNSRLYRLFIALLALIFTAVLLYLIIRFF